MPKDRRGSCWSWLQKDKDPYIKAWLDETPATTVSKAVWEYSRDEVAFKPYRWDGLAMSPVVPSATLNHMFNQMQNMQVGHPTDLGTITILLWFFLVHLPIIAMSRLFSILIWGDWVLFTVISVMSGMYWLWIAFRKKQAYKKALKERETQLARLLDHITVTSLAAYRIKAVGGKCGAWVELQFEDPSTFMVMGAPGFGHYAPQGGAGIPNNANPFGYHQPPQFA